MLRLATAAQQDRPRAQSFDLSRPSIVVAGLDLREGVEFGLRFAAITLIPNM